MFEVLQNTRDLRFSLGQETLQLLLNEFNIPAKWQCELEQIGEVECGKTSLALLLDGWFGNGNQQVAAAIEQAAAIVYCRHQTSVPVIETIVLNSPRLPQPSQTQRK